MAIAHDAILASNTSTLPITGLADCSDRPARCSSPSRSK
ncbi:hypothetical protein J8I32_16740 [Cupriavidus sp. AcVe19-1a]|nr:hypothetical protein [Cupriavidus sp. AcVe19-1a]